MDRSRLAGSLANVHSVASNSGTVLFFVLESDFELFIHCRISQTTTLFLPLGSKKTMPRSTNTFASPSLANVTDQRNSSVSLDVSHASIASSSNREVQQMLKSRTKLDGLLSQASSLFPKSSRLLSSENVSLLQKALTQMVEGDDILQMLQRTLARFELGVIRRSDDLDVPGLDLSIATLYGTTTSSDLILDLADPEDIKAQLGARKCIIGVEHVCDGTVSEMTQSEYCDMDEDISYEIGVFQRLKQEDRKEWEFKWGGIEYARLSQRIVQAVLQLDLQLDIEAGR